jgi:hypothetical protein
MRKKRTWAQERKDRMGSYAYYHWSDGNGNRIFRRNKEYQLQSSDGALWDLEARTLAEAKVEVEQYLSLL